VKRDVKIGRATHLMHLEENRYALYHEAQTFLDEGHHQRRLNSIRRPMVDRLSIEAMRLIA